MGAPSKGLDSARRVVMAEDERSRFATVKTYWHTQPRRFYDGMALRDSAGHQYVVWEPRWWQLGRWLRLWRSKRRGRVTVFTMAGDYGETETVRVIGGG